MSDQNPPENLPQPEGLEPTEPLAVDTSAPEQSRRGRRTAIVALVALVVSAVLGGGAFAVYTVFFDGGPQPAEVLPVSTVAVLSIDLDPSAGQKIEALKTIRKFPRLKEDLGLDPTDDLRKFFVEKAIDCDGVDFDEEVKPWVGKRAAVAAVDLGGDTPVPVLALQITDQKKADAGFEKLVECAEEDLGYIVGTEYLIASDTAEHAQAVLASGEEKSLADDPKYQKWTDEAGDAGVVNFYVAKRASDYLIDGLESISEELLGFGGDGEFDEEFGEFDEESFSDGGGFAGESAPRAADEDCSDALEDPFAAVKDQLEDFDGLAGTIRFADGGMELAVAAGGFAQYGSQESVGDEVGALPADTTLAAGFAVPKDYAQDLVDQLSCGAEAGGPDLVAEIEEGSGLELPEDLTTLLGTALTLSVGGDAPENLVEIEGPADLPVGLALHGDAAGIEDVIATIEETLGMSLEDEVGVGTTSSDSIVVLSPSEDYADALLGKGGLGTSDEFREAVPEADRAAAILYLDFDSEWRTALLDLALDDGVSESDVETARENTEPLKSLGISSWVEGDASHVLLKLATR